MFLIIKLDLDGNIIWQKTYDSFWNDVITSIKQTNDQGYIAVGIIQGEYAYTTSYCILRLNASGDIIWSKYLDGSGYDDAYSVQQTNDGNFIIAGIGSGGNFWIVKMDQSANILWERTYGGAGIDYAYSIQQTTDNGYIIAGETSSYGAGSSDAWVIKIDSSGNIVWQKTYGGPAADSARSIQQTADGGYILACITRSYGSGNDDIWILKLDSNGSIGSSCSFINTSNSAATVPSSTVSNLDISIYRGPFFEFLTAVPGLNIFMTGIFQCGCTSTAPVGVSADITGLNQITISWQPVPGASSYNIYRKYSLCSQEQEELIANDVVSTSYLDTTVSGGITYQYSVTAKDQCESSQSNRVQATATGDCYLSPCFNGAKRVINAHASNCLLIIQWDPAASNCSAYPDLTYTIYRSNMPDFIPASGNQIATCITGTKYYDGDLNPGQPYYYVVRAEDSNDKGPGLCNNGNTDINFIKKANSPTGSVANLFVDDFEAGLSNWNISSHWNWSNLFSNNGLYSAYSGNYANQLCDTLTKSNFVLLPSSAASIRLYFSTRYKTYKGMDAGIVQGSTDDITWTQLSMTPDYPWTANSTQACLGPSTQRGFTGSGTTWREYISDLSSFAGSNFKVRFNYAARSEEMLGGWWIDDVLIDAENSCQNGTPDCTNAPLFAGLQTAASGNSSACQVNLAWEHGLSTCPSAQNITYHIYKSTDPGFVPSPSNRIASCIAGTAYTDSNVAYGTAYYYIVRAEDSSANGNGPCNNGNSDMNVVRKVTYAYGSIAIAFIDDFESGIGKWQATGIWGISSAQSHSPFNSMYSGAAFYLCEMLTLNGGIFPPAGSQPQLFFWTYYNITNGTQGGVVEVSTDDGSTWTKLDLIPFYPGKSNSGAPGCLGADQSCFTGVGTNWAQYRADLSAYESANLKLRFKYVTEGSNLHQGWFIDDIIIQWKSACYTVSNTPGTVPDNNNYPGVPLTIRKSGEELNLNWGVPGGPCQTQDYGIYRGTLPWTNYNHSSILCTTAGVTSANILADLSSYYFLVVAQNDDKEGSYGVDSSNIHRPPASIPCLLYEIGNCN